MSQSELVEKELDILSCIDKAFSRFGPSVANVVYWKFSFTTKLGKNQIQQRPDLFSSTLREIFRDGAGVIEQAIINELISKYNLPNRNYKDLEDTVSSIKMRNVSKVL